jgi:hypothetical protein
MPLVEELLLRVNRSQSEVSEVLGEAVKAAEAGLLLPDDARLVLRETFAVLKQSAAVLDASRSRIQSAYKSQVDKAKAGFLRAN